MVSARAEQSLSQEKWISEISGGEGEEAKSRCDTKGPNVQNCCGHVCLGVSVSQFMMAGTFHE